MGIEDNNPRAEKRMSRSELIEHVGSIMKDFPEELKDALKEALLTGDYECAITELKSTLGQVEMLQKEDKRQRENLE